MFYDIDNISIKLDVQLYMFEPPAVNNDRENSATSSKETVFIMN
jgi:hypothetical protein